MYWNETSMKRAIPSEICRIKRFAIVDLFWTENAPAAFMRQKLAVFSFLVPKNGGTQDGLMHSVCPGCDRAVCCSRSGSFRSLLWRLPLRTTKRALRLLNFKFCLEHTLPPTRARLLRTQNDSKTRCVMHDPHKTILNWFAPCRREYTFSGPTLR